MTSYGTSFIGREKELEVLDGLLANERLVTMLGPSGVGKTRLARRLAERRMGAGQVVLFCDLLDATTVESMCTALAGILEAPLTGTTVDETVDDLGRMLASRGRSLVVFDNFEPLVDVGALALEKLFDLARDATFLVTSRVRLHRPPGCCFDLPPLALPAEDEKDPALIARSEAVRLFANRAKLARADFELSSEDASVVAAIVRHLDGIPLAIELCAGRASMLGIRQLLELLPRQLDTLGSASSSSSSRHGSLRREIDRSWDQLTEPEREALAVCSIFRGGWTLAAAEHLLGPRALDLLQALHDRSLVQTYEPVESSGVRRYKLYESVRAYAAERLVELGLADVSRRAHAAYFLKAYGGLSPEYVDFSEPRFRRDLQHDLGNFEVLLESARRAPRESESISALLEVLVAIAPVPFTRGPLESYAKRLGDVLEDAEKVVVDERLKGRAFFLRGWAFHVRGRHTDAVASLTHASELAERTHDVATFTLARGKLGCAEALMGNVEDACAHFEAAFRRISRGDVSALVRARVLCDHAFLLSRQGYARRAIHDLEEALLLFREVGVRLGEGTVLVDLAGRNAELGDLDSAAEQAEEALEILRELGNRRLESAAAIYAGAVALERGSPERARELLEHARALASDVGARPCEAFSRQCLGNVELTERRYEHAREHYAYAERIHRSGHDARHAALCVAAKAVALVHLGRFEQAEVSFERAASELAEAALPSDAVLLDFFRAHLDVVKARQAATRGDAIAERAALDRVRRLLAETVAISSGEEGSTHEPDEVRFARALLSQHLKGASTPQLTVASNADWFQLLGTPRVELGKRTLLKNLVLAFVRQHHVAPTESLSLDALFSMVWPGESVRAEAAINRTKVALTALRNLGLRDVLQTHEGGYRLDPKIAVVVVQDEA